MAVATRSRKKTTTTKSKKSAASDSSQARNGGGRIGGISAEAVKKATGHDWAHWLKVLDKFDVKAHGHKEAAIYLHEKHGVGEWWCQMVVVGYEQARGLRKKHEKTDGFSVSKSKVLAAPVEKAFRAWNDAALRTKWLGENGLTVRKSTPHKSVRITWKDGRTSVEVMLYPKGAGRCQVSVQHNKLASEAAVTKMKAYWGKAMERLAEAIE